MNIPSDKYITAIDPTLKRRVLFLVRNGWAEWSFIFYIGAIGALLGSYFKLAGVSATLLALGFFYGAGKLHEHAEKRIKKRD